MDFRITWALLFKCLEYCHTKFRPSLTDNNSATADRVLLYRRFKVPERNVSNVVSSPRNLFAGEPEIKAESYTGRRSFLTTKRTSVPSRFASTSICHGWMFSKAICPSTGYAGPYTRKLSHSAWSTYFSANNPACRKFSPRGNTGKGVLCGTTSRRRRFSSGDSSCNKTSTSDRCGDRTSANQETPKDQCSKRKPDSCSSVPMEVCPKPSTTCTPSVKDPCPKPCPPPVHPAPEKSTPCPNVDDYCVTEVSQKERFYRFLSLFVAMPLILVMSIYVYTREMEKKKQPRPEFVDVPYMRRILKPFPWGDGRHTLFHNPVKNPISPHGYEVEDPNAPKTGEPKD